MNSASLCSEREIWVIRSKTVLSMYPDDSKMRGWKWE
jgi:hypothetical protein